VDADGGGSEGALVAGGEEEEEGERDNDRGAMERAARPPKHGVVSVSGPAPIDRARADPTACCISNRCARPFPPFIGGQKQRFRTRRKPAGGTLTLQVAWKDGKRASAAGR